jgi:D-amino-acid dehydrogenase
MRTIFVLCTGSKTNRLARQLGEALPIYPIKGYSVTLDMIGLTPKPTANVTDLSRKMVLAPLGGKLRVAAMAEVVGNDTRIPPDRIEQVLAAVEQVFPGLCSTAQSSAWAGLRPATPDSVPIIRNSRVPNVVLNVGHGALGFTLAAGSARLAAGLIETA